MRNYNACAFMILDYGGYLSNRARKTEENKGKPIKAKGSYFRFSFVFVSFLKFSLVLFAFLRFS